MANILDTMGVSPALTWLRDMISLYNVDEIKIPAKYRDKVLEVKKILKDDVSGLVNSILDFAIDTALVEYRIETNNSNLTILLNNWLKNVNSDLRGKVPTGIKALAKEYFRERWKGSSFLLLRSLFDTKDGFNLPVKLWFVKGEDIIVLDGNNGIRILGDETYYLRTNSKNTDKQKIKLPNKEGEKIFIQKPYSSWDELEPVPFIIQRGIYHNLKFLQLIAQKGEFVINKALEYLMLLKKGSERLALTGKPEFVYGDEDYKKIREQLTEFLSKRKTERGISLYTTGFDTEIEHIIPEYNRILSQELYIPIERRLLAGLGLIEIVQGIASTRRESILNPKPFIAEVESAINDFKLLLEDILYTIVDENKNNHPKYFKGDIFVRVVSSPVKLFMDRDIKQILRSLYDRGLLSKQTTIEILGNLDYDIEKQRRDKEIKQGDDVVFYPPVIVNRESEMYIPDFPDDDKKFNRDKETENKQGPEKLNFVQSDKIFEQAPYKKISELPDNVKNVMGKSLQRIWMDVFNKAINRYGDEDIARKVAWSVIKKIARKNKDGKWVRFNKSTLDIDKELEELENWC